MCSQLGTVSVPGRVALRLKPPTVEAVDRNPGEKQELSPSSLLKSIKVKEFENHADRSTPRLQLTLSSAIFPAELVAHAQPRPRMSEVTSNSTEGRGTSGAFREKAGRFFPITLGCAQARPPDPSRLVLGRIRGRAKVGT